MNFSLVIPVPRGPTRVCTLILATCLIPTSPLLDLREQSIHGVLHYWVTWKPSAGADTVKHVDDVVHSLGVRDGYNSDVPMYTDIHLLAVHAIYLPDPYPGPSFIHLDRECP